jgi:peptidoglycan/LPS O-acetylase OafA/YrhL
VVYHFWIDWKLPEFAGYYSVTLFFELSGLLITWLLLKEIATTKTVNLKQFYLRRSLRLFPVFYVVWIICRLGGAFPGSWFYFFYLGDYFTALTGKYSVLTSAWSLGIEEKFYLIWPQFVVRVGLPGLTKILLAVLAIDPLLRWLLTLAGHEYYTHFAFETNLGPIVLGCLIAVMVKRGWSPPAWMLHPLALIGAMAAVVLLWRSIEVVTFALAIALIYLICRPPAILNNALAKFLGAISYSIYLIHEWAAHVLWPWAFRWNEQLSSPQRLPVWAGLPLEVALSIAAAAVLHYAVERPFLRMKDRLHAKALPVAASR